MWWYHIVVLICISLITNDGEQLCVCLLARKKKYFFCKVSSIFFFILTWGHFFIAFRDRRKKRGGERNIDVRERSINWLPPVSTWTRDWTHNLGMSPDWKSNLQPYSLQDDAPTNWATLAMVRLFNFFFASFYVAFIFLSLSVRAVIYTRYKPFVNVCFKYIFSQYVPFLVTFCSSVFEE